MIAIIISIILRTTTKQPPALFQLISPNKMIINYIQFKSKKLRIIQTLFMKTKLTQMYSTFN